MIQWGAAIDTKGKRPEWLSYDEKHMQCTCHDSTVLNTPGTEWDRINGIRLPADHPYYTATNAGYTYWPGGDEAPADWDGGDVMVADGSVLHNRAPRQLVWDGDIIGYKRLTWTAVDMGTKTTHHVKGEFMRPGAPAAIPIQPRSKSEWSELFQKHGGAIEWLQTVGLVTEPTDAERAQELLSHRKPFEPIADVIEQGIKLGRELQQAGK